MKKLSILLTLLFSIITMVHSQDKAYFQQKVGYVINVTLNDEAHSLEGDIEVSYTNNSPDEINFIYFHLWPNAYKNANTAYAKQAKENGSTAFFYAEKGDRGYIDRLNFLADGKEISWDYDPDNVDIAILNLDKPLKSGGTIQISTPFFVQIPKSYSRLGHVGQSYQMTQWFPKPAVYDHKGWHPMPYLDQGEFYSEFGDFDVTITLPENYVVGATGELQTKSEVEVLNRKVEETKGKAFKQVYDEKEGQQEIPTSSEATKTIRYTATNVHDFAWFADKRFHVAKDQVTLESGKTVDTWVMFTDFEGHLWRDAIKYVNRSVEFYSAEVGEYPYPHATAVQSALSAGGGMEYPMITVIGASGDAHGLDIVITHEVGHNWFYGILGSNERIHPWMDEGMNSFYEKKYNLKYYGMTDSLSQYLPSFISKGLGVGDAEIGYFGYLYKARTFNTQAIETPSQDLTNSNYFLSAYDRPAAALQYLEHYLGEATFKQIMKKYYKNWEFKHPYPEDFRRLFEAETGKDLSWFFDGILGSKGEKSIDYAVKKVGKKNVTVENEQSINGPFSISILKGGKIVATEWHEGFEGSKEIPLPAGDHDEVRLDAIKVIPEINRNNNGQKRPLKLTLLAGTESPERKTMSITPLIGFNNYDKFMAGAAIHNFNLIPQKVDYVIAPMFSTGATDVVGFADVRYNHYSNNGLFKRISPGIGLKSFNFIENKTYDYNEKFIRVNPFIELEMNKRPRNPVSHSFRAEVPLIWEQDAQLVEVNDSTRAFDGYEYITRPGAVVTYTYKKKGLHPLTFSPQIEYRSLTNACNGDAEGYVKASITGKLKFHYTENRAMKVRFYGAGVIVNSQSETCSGSISPVSLISRGSTDYFYDDFYLGRTQGRTIHHPDNILSQQINPNREGGIRVPVPGGSSIGQSDVAAFAVNLTIDLPIKQINFPVKPYLDLGYYAIKDDPSGLLSPLVVDFGLALEFGDAIGIYVPIAGTKNIMDSNKSLGGFFNRIGFKIDLNEASPRKLLSNFDF